MILKTNNFWLKVPTFTRICILIYFLTTCSVCEKDTDCDYSDCEYCTSIGLCRRYDREYCDDLECGIGDGDCDPGTCSDGLMCGKNNFLHYHPLLAHCVSRSQEVCVDPGIFK